MKRQALKIILITSITLSGCAKKELILADNINLNNGNGTLTFLPIPTNCINGFKPTKVKLKEEKKVGYFIEVSVCKIDDNSIKFKQINTMENLDEVLFSEKTYEKLPYYNCNTEEAKREKYKRVSICKKSDGFSELVILSPKI
ncbi:hypothetical protein [Aliarcobacter butzleri]|uniref:hypothetical protein n=1 Tax=Aliarcobacter butzleri TaxID=28197 RepID=UPI0012607BBE|nr:hypothetical protein [Aliarcobacter butzleri]